MIKHNKRITLVDQVSLKRLVYIKLEYLIIMNAFAFKDYDNADIGWMKSAILDQWDLDKDGKIDKQELSILLLQQGRMVAREEGWPSETEEEEEDEEEDDDD